MSKPKTLEEALLRLQMVDRTQLAELLSVSQEQLSKLIKCGALPRPAVFAGHIQRWPLSWIVECLENLQNQQRQAAVNKEHEA